MRGEAMCRLGEDSESESLRRSDLGLSTSEF